MGDLAHELRRVLHDPHRVLEALHLLDRTSQRQAGGYLIRCPAHADSSPSCSVTRGRDGTLRARCFSCGWTGDVLTLVGRARGLDTHHDFHQVLAAAAELAGRWDLVAELEGGEPRPQAPSPPQTPTPPATPERTYPDGDTVADLLAACVPVDQDADASHLLRSRGLDPIDVAVRDLAYALPPSCNSLPGWARFRGRSWVETGHRLIVPVYDHLGALRSVRAWRVTDADTPKRLPPAGHRAGGLVMLDAMGREAFKAGGWPSWNPNPPRFVIVEGEPDHLTVAVRTPLRQGPPTHAVVGVVSGSWTSDLAAAIPTGAAVSIWTDHDQGGDGYAQTIAHSLSGRCCVLRGRT